MAARKTLYLDDRWREKIQVSMLLNRLNNHIENAEKTPLIPTQLKAIEILLRKVLPDLKAVEHTGDMAMQVTKIVEEIVDARPMIDA